MQICRVVAANRKIPALLPTMPRGPLSLRCAGRQGFVPESAGEIVGMDPFGPDHRGIGDGSPVRGRGARGVGVVRFLVTVEKSE